LPAACASRAALRCSGRMPHPQGHAELAALSSVSARATVLIAALLFALLFAAPPGRWRWFVAAGAAWATARGLFGPAVLPPALFSPATFFPPLLGAFSASPGCLLPPRGLPAF